MKRYTASIGWILMALAIAGCGEKEAPPPMTFTGPPDYVSSTACIECHATEYALWNGSQHDLAMTVASDTTVLGDFDDAALTIRGRTSRFHKRDGRFVVYTDGPDGEMADFDVAYTFGIEPLQQYLVDIGDGKIQALPFAWDTGRNQWFHLFPDDSTVAGDPFHWTGLYQRWNARCADCHSTDLRKNYNVHEDRYATEWSEIDVGCEACHGPGSNHIEWARRVGGDGRWNPADRKGLQITFAADTPGAEITSCAPCHSRRRKMSAQYRHGDQLLDHYAPQLLAEGLYHADGQILAEVYVYGSFVQSKMYRAGVRCTDCHDPHAARLKLEGNTLCVTCHQPNPPSRFPTLQAKRYDSPEHHFHTSGTSGSKCVDCHMISRDYMIVDPRRDHSFRVPRPDVTMRIGTPNACGDCHTDRTAQWAVDEIAKRYPEGVVARGERHFGDVFAAARHGDPGAEIGLIEIALGEDEPAIVRATALSLLAIYASASATLTIADALGDADPLVRLTAVEALEALSPRNPGDVAQYRKLHWLGPLLSDPVRAVRAEAARSLTDVSQTIFTPELRHAFRSALAEFRRTQQSLGDEPGGHLNLGVVFANQRNAPAAMYEYKLALKMDNTFNAARFNLANLLNTMGRNEEAETALREIVEREPDNGEAFYSLGLLLAELQRFEEAEAALQRATELLPQRARILFNLSLVYQRLARIDDAQASMLNAYAIDPLDPRTLEALAIFYATSDDLDTALRYAREMLDVDPGSTKAENLVRQLEGRLER